MNKNMMSPIKYRDKTDTQPIRDVNGKPYTFCKVLVVELEERKNNNSFDFVNNTPVKNSCYKLKPVCMANGLSLNPGAKGNKIFCTFVRIHTSFNGKQGIYAVFYGDKLKYIGETQNMGRRWSHSDYASISPRNCFKGGQSTNCHINSDIAAEKIKNPGEEISVWFLETDGLINTARKALEENLIDGNKNKGVTGVSLLNKQHNSHS